MKVYNDITDLIKNYKQLEYGGIYREAAKDIHETRFWVMSSNEQKNGEMYEGEGMYMPLKLYELGARSWLPTATFEDIIDLKLENGTATLADTDKLIAAIEHYLEFDDFED